MPATDLIAAARAVTPLTPLHYSGSLIVSLRRTMNNAGFECGEIRWNHGDGRHAFDIVMEGRTHTVTIAPDMAEMRAEMAGQVAA